MFGYAAPLGVRWRRSGTINFKGSQFEREIMLWAVRWYVAYPITYRQLEAMTGEQKSMTIASSRSMKGYHKLSKIVCKRKPG